MISEVCTECRDTGKIYRPVKKKWVIFYLIDLRGYEERHQKLETVGGTDACPACTARAEAEYRLW